MVGPFWRQAWTVSAVLINMVGQGMLLSFPSSLLPALQAPDSPIKAELSTLSWMSSSCGVAGIPGFLLSSVLMDIYGRRMTHAMVILPGIIGWMLVYFATNVPALLIGRILGGITAGATVSLGAIVIGEYSDPKYRGVFLNLKTASVCLGGMTTHILGNFFQWRTVALLTLVPHFVALSIVFTWTESPSWLASIGRYDDSKKAFFWLRGKSENSYAEIDELINAQVERRNDIQKTKYKEDVLMFFKKFSRKDFIKPLIIVLVGNALLESSGRHTFPAYALQIIEEITGDKTKSFYYTLAIDIIITSSAVFSSILVKLMKRRTLLFSTGFASIFVLIIVCTYLFLAAQGTITNSHPWIPISLFVVYFILVNLGCTPIPLAFLGELFPLAHRGVGSAISGVWMSLGVMVGLQVTPCLLLNIKVYGTFATFGVVMAFMLIILYFTLPETKDRTLQEIEDHFNNTRCHRDQEEAEAKIRMLSKDVISLE